MYTCYLLSDTARETLLKLYPPKYSRVICHHITIQFGAPEGTPLPEKPKVVEVVGYANDEDGLEAFTVRVDGKDKRPDGKLYHITHSLNPSKFKPVDSNTLVNSAGSVKKIDPIVIKVLPDIQKG